MSRAVRYNRSLLYNNFDIKERQKERSFLLQSFLLELERCPLDMVGPTFPPLSQNF